MQPAALEKWVWLLIYGGLLTLALGLALLRSEAPWGWLLVGLGGMAAAAGVVLIFVRARLPATDAAPQRTPDT